MNKLKVQILIVFVVIYEVQGPPVSAIPRYVFNFCPENHNITSSFYPSVYKGYEVDIWKPLNVATQIKVKLDSGSTIELNDDAQFSAEKDTINNIFSFIVVKDVQNLKFTVKGRTGPNHPPYITSLKINGVEICKNPDQTYFQNFAYGGVGKLFDKAPDKFCGRRRIYRRYTELIVSGSPTKAGDWPWHAALMRLDKSTLKYICGGTLMSKYIVLTAHCAVINGAPVNPEILQVVLGKYSLVAKDIAVQEKDVFKVIVHDEFQYKTLENDIALLKLTTEVSFNNYVQPACLWFDGIYDHIGSYEINGTVVGWGFDKTDSLSSTLKSASVPQIPDFTCIKFDPVFYTNVLTGNKFCGGNLNGTAACNGDSGGGFMVFVRDDFSSIYYKNLDDINGAWYIKGIVSISLARFDASICDPNAYTVFTDVAVYKDWILSHMS